MRFGAGLILKIELTGMALCGTKIHDDVSSRQSGQERAAGEPTG